MTTPTFFEKPILQGLLDVGAKRGPGSCESDDRGFSIDVSPNATLTANLFHKPVSHEINRWRFTLTHKYAARSPGEHMSLAARHGLSADTNE